MRWGSRTLGGCCSMFAQLLGLSAAVALVGVSHAQVVALDPPVPQQNGQFGIVAGLSDVDGDGLGDVAVAALGEMAGSLPSAGRVHLFSGGDGTFIRTLVSAHPESGGGFGERVVGIADLNGDGRGEIIVGAPLEDGSFLAVNIGRVYVFSGSNGAVLHELLSPLQQEQGAFGSAIARVPDANGDGVEDILVGAPREEFAGTPFDSGRAYLFSGQTGMLLRAFDSPEPQFIGYFGDAVSGVPDVDGDGRGDVLIGASREFHDSGFYQSGRAYLFSGATGALIHTFLTPTPTTEGRFGRALAGIADIDSDGRGDVVIAGPAEPQPKTFDASGRVYVFSGATGRLLHELASPEEVIVQFGYSIAPLPDFNRDGLDDLVVGSFDDAFTALDNGNRAFVYSAATGQSLGVFRSPAQEYFGLFGYSVSAIADVNGDGRGEILVGAPLENPGVAPLDSGRAYVFRSRLADLDADGYVAPSDLQMLLGAWGRCPKQGPCVADLNGDDIVNALDLAILLASWSPS